ncbi:MAG: hypothetical protein H6714_10205 [Myxococcales bacterium]|nr:hypothetical protein [Myxococcales bacterium]
MKTSLAALLTTLGLLLLTGSAYAQVNVFDQSERWFSLGADLGFYAGSQNGVDHANMSMILHAGGRIHENVDLELQLPGTLHAYSDGTEDEVRFRFANPSIGAYFVTQNKIGMWRLGGFFAAPLASVPGGTGIDHIVAADAYGYASAMRGNWNYWLWAPSTTTIGASSQLEWSVLPVLSLAADGALAALIDSGNGRAQSDMMGQLAGEAALKAGEVVRLGVRLAGVWLPTADGDNFQSFVEPFARLQFLMAYVFAAVTINLDEPNGFSFDSGKVWAIRAGGGLRF